MIETLVLEHLIPVTDKIIKIKSSEMTFPTFWEYVDPINCNKVTS
jgi:hypothetical protein